MSVWDALDNNKILQGDCLEVLKTLPDESVDTCVTSPPYYGLRDYGTGEWIGGDPNCKHESAAYVLHPKGGSEKQRSNYGSEVTAYEKVCPVCGAIRVDHQIGLEDTPEQYVQRLVDVFREVKRVLKADGTLWVNIGDSYAGGAGRWGGLNDISEAQKANKGSLTQIQTARKWTHAEIKPKDLIGIPWLLAFALRSDGWYLRQDIIWHKPGPMPESVKDRFTKSHEYIFLFSKMPKYYFDHEAVQEDATYFGSGTTGVVANKFNRSFIGIELNKEYIELAKKRTANKQITLEGVI